jgi:iron complex outermembrane receptor protein/hemoglobin/transferrin/lactoferrin receptor protein
MGLERVETLRGPSSTTYGSAAIGGVVSVLTRDPAFSEKPLIRPFFTSKFATANSEKMLGGGVDIYTNKLSIIVEGGFRDVGDVNPGKGADIIFDNRKFVITSDPDPGDIPAGARVVDIQEQTAWQGYGGNAKAKMRLGGGTLKLGYQASRQDEVPRYDKISTGEYDTYLFAPQNRDMVYATYRLGDLLIVPSYHRQEEGRISRKSGSSKISRKTDTVHTLGLSAQSSRSVGKHRFTAGMDLYFDNLDSWGESEDTDTGETKRVGWGRFPDGSQFSDLNLFGQAELELFDRLHCIAGGRFTRYRTKSDLSLRDPLFGTLDSSGNALTGQAGLIFGLLDGVNVYANLSQGFRAPSLNDTTAVEVTNEGIDAPNPDLDPERSLSAEIGVKFRSRILTGSIAAYRMNIDGLVARTPIEDYFADGEIPGFYRNLKAEHPDTDIFVHDNIDSATITGLELEGRYQFVEGAFIHGNFTILRGKNDANEQPIRREQPPKGMIGLLWDLGNQTSAELYTRGAAEQKRLASGDIRDPRIPGTTRDTSVDDPQAGTPGWYTVNLRFAKGISDKLHISAELGNILDKRYREHGSGINGLGRNLAVSLNGNL